MTTPLTKVPSQGERTNAKLNKPDNDGKTALIYAASQGRTAIIRALANQKDLDVNHQDLGHKSALVWAAGNGHEAAVRALLEVGGISVNNDGGYSPLGEAAEYGHEAVVRLLLAHGVSINSEDFSQCTPLARAAGGGHEPVVRLLLAEKDIIVREKEGFISSALALAAWKGKAAIVRLLIAEHSLSINDPLDLPSRPTQLCLAALWGDEYGVANLLAQDGLSVNKKDADGKTPLHLAAFGRGRCLIDNGPIDRPSRLAVVKLLLEREDIDIYAKDNDSHTPRDMARLAHLAHDHHWSELLDLLDLRLLADKRRLAERDRGT